jgi:hypothetical protein
MKETLQNMKVLALSPRTKAIDNHKSWPIEIFVMKETLQNTNVLTLCPRTKAIDNHKL